VQVLVTALDMFGSGDEFVRRAATIQPLLGVVLVTDAARSGDAPQGAQSGPVQRLFRPITRESLGAAIQRILDRQTRRRPACRAPACQCGEDTAPPPGNPCPATSAESARFIAASRLTQEVLETAWRCAPTDAPVLIHGEPDTGKELLAREMHRRSRRAAGPFVHVACGALRDSELAQRLFGQPDRAIERGAEAPGSLLEKVHGGTLFLENVAELPLWAQVKLLDVLQQERCFRAGSNESVALDVRVMASTAVDLRAAVARDAFLSSLYYYLNVVEIHVPPLRHRPQDIRPLAERCLALANSMRNGQGTAAPRRFSDDAFQCLTDYAWPGNILQLRSVVTHAVLLAEDDEISGATVAKLLGAFIPHNDADTVSVPLMGGLKDIERAVIAAVIERCGGNKAAAARMLRLHRRTLYRILHDEVPAKQNAIPLPLTLGPSAGDYAANFQFGAR
jgi:DNA-binding NtrC family response regulator